MNSFGFATSLTLLSTEQTLKIQFVHFKNGSMLIIAGKNHKKLEQCYVFKQVDFLITCCQFYQ